MFWLCSKNKMSCVHRDLKPANLMLGGIPHDSTDLSLGGELGVIKIADFGLSKSLAQNVQAANSRRGLDTAASGLNEEDGLEGHEIERWAASNTTQCQPKEPLCIAAPDVRCNPWTSFQKLHHCYSVQPAFGQLMHVYVQALDARKHQHSHRAWQ